MPARGVNVFVSIQYVVYFPNITYAAFRVPFFAVVITPFSSALPSLETNDLILLSEMAVPLIVPLTLIGASFFPREILYASVLAVHTTMPTRFAD